MKHTDINGFGRRPRAAIVATLGLVVTAAVVAVAAAPASASIRALAAAKDPAAVAAASADALVAGNAPALLKGAGDTMIRTKVQPGANGLQYVAYERTYRGLSVVGGDAVIVTNSAGTVLNTVVAQSAVIDVGTTPSVSASAALATAKARLATVTEASTPRLAVLAWGTPRLVWESVVTGASATAPSKLHVFVDALTGTVTDSYDEVRAGTGNSFYNGTVTIATSGSGTSWSMQDSTRPGIRCGGQNGVTFTGTDDVWGNGSGTNLETACVDALYAVQREWDMLGSWLGRNGINGSGGGFPARVGLNQVNAFWNGSFTNFGHSQDNLRQATPQDVVAHEFGHAIFQTTPGGAGSGNENGGLNEATGDIFGALTEHFANNPNDPPDFLVGEEVNLVGSGPIRNMFNPSALGDPNCWSTAIPSTEVHAAAGPLNHWFYLMSQGSNPPGGPASPICAGGPASVTGIGIQDAGRVYYNAMLAKTSTWRYANVRLASLNAAVNLFGASSSQCASVKAAWNAVSVPVQAGEPTCAAPGNDFSISVSPTSGSTAAGGSVSATVSTAVTSGSAQTVSLSASGLPSGASASFSPSSVTAGGSSSMTITTSTGTPTGTFTVSITGTGTSATHSTPFSLTVTGGGGGTTVFSDTFETATGWTTNGSGTDTATTGSWVRGDPAATSSGGVQLQLGTTVSGTNDLVTGAPAGTSAGANDVDGGVTTMQSPLITVPAGTINLSFSWYLAHLNNATSADFFRVSVISGSTTTVVFSQAGAATNRAGAWATANVNLSSFAGQTIRLRVEAADAGTASLIEAGVDNVTVTQS